TWLNPVVPDHTIQPAKFFSVHRMDRTLETGKSCTSPASPGVKRHWTTTIKDGYKTQSRPLFGKSDHATISLMPKYKQRLKQEVPAQLVAALQVAIDDADWDMFQHSSDDINMFMEAVVGFIGKLADDTVQKTIIRMFPNQKLWVDKTICDALRSCDAAYNVGLASGDMDSYKAVSYNVRKVVKETKQRYGRKQESQLQQSDSRSLWQVLRTITDYKAPTSESIIVPVPKKTHPASLNNYRPVALTSVAMKCLEQLVRDFIISSLPDTLDPLQFAYRPNHSTDDAISHLLHTSLTHLDTGKGIYVKMLFSDYSSVFNTIIPSTLTTKLEHLGLSPSLCQWTSNFLTGRPQAVKMGRHVSASLTLSTGAPQGCVLSPLLYSLYTYDCVATTNSTTIIKFADDTVVVGLISDNNEMAYLEDI
ncbi:hypothetical protein QTP86_017580, partial [Hemibagrus guttatus]